ncbi:right-handed parallel beta-helix repeat-containing protein [Pseudomonas sp. IT-P176]|uniref:right-handed parallel beta-helix repeat-containing protein n=1 Tax=Pseudomonas sp. IT-P176 TaxID=3026444 RepID=UPI0039DFA764
MTLNKTKLNRILVMWLPLTLAASFWPLPSNAKENQKCQLPHSGNLAGNVTLEPSCTYFETMTINTSNTNIDCKGATLDGRHTEKTGILISSKGNHLTNVNIKNCTVTNFTQMGILVTSEIPNFQRSNDRAKNYADTPSNITLDNMHVLSNDGVGVYFHSYVSNSTLKNSRIAGSKAEGIYLDQSSRYNTILNNIIEKNGELNGPNSGQRVGLAIDSSANNLIKNNKFLANLAGGVFLYKNCGENFSKGMSVIRWQHSNENQITNNYFIDEKVGIWIASRQSSNLEKKDCGDTPIDTEGKHYQDFADYNTVESNTFCRNKTYIRIEGNYNTITNNHSDIISKKWIFQPTSMKERITGIPTIGNKISNNGYKSCNK